MSAAFITEFFLPALDHVLLVKRTLQAYYYCKLKLSDDLYVVKM